MAGVIQWIAPAVHKAMEGIIMCDDNNGLPPGEDIMSLAYEIDDHLHVAAALLAVAHVSGMRMLDTEMRQYFLSAVKEEVSAAIEGHNRAAKFHQGLSV